MAGIDGFRLWKSAGGLLCVELRGRARAGRARGRGSRSASPGFRRSPRRCSSVTSGGGHDRPQPFRLALDSDAPERMRSAGYRAPAGQRPPSWAGTTSIWPSPILIGPASWAAIEAILWKCGRRGAYRAPVAHLVPNRCGSRTHPVGRGPPEEVFHVSIPGEAGALRLGLTPTSRGRICPR